MALVAPSSVMGFNRVWGGKRRRKLLRAFGQENLLKDFSCLSQAGQKRLQMTLNLVIAAALILAIARPAIPHRLVKLKTGSLDVAAVLDVSRSMAAEDYAGILSRLKKAKQLLIQLLPDLSGNRLGLVVFAGDSFVQAELTDDLTALKFVLQNWVNIESAPLGGSNLTEALSEAVDLLTVEAHSRAPLLGRDRKREKLILLFSDGGISNPGSLSTISEKISSKGIKVIGIGLGNLKGSRIPVYDQKGQFLEWQKFKGQIVSTRLNEGVLKEIAAMTKGTYVRIISGKELRSSLKDPKIVGKKSIIGDKEVFQFPVGFALLLISLKKIISR